MQLTFTTNGDVMVKQLHSDVSTMEVEVSSLQSISFNPAYRDVTRPPDHLDVMYCHDARNVTDVMKVTNSSTSGSSICDNTSNITDNEIDVVQQSHNVMDVRNVTNSGSSVSGDYVSILNVMDNATDTTRRLYNALDVTHFTDTSYTSLTINYVNYVCSVHYASCVNYAKLCSGYCSDYCSGYCWQQQQQQRY